MLRLRTSAGLGRASAEARLFTATLAWGAATSLVEGNRSSLVLTQQGRLLAGELFERLVPDLRSDVHVA